VSDIKAFIPLDGRLDAVFEDVVRLLVYSVNLEGPMRNTCVCCE